jgi:hypothetical protein
VRCFLVGVPNNSIGSIDVPTRSTWAFKPDLPQGEVGVCMITMHYL